MFLFCTAELLYHCEHGGVDLMGLKPNPKPVLVDAWPNCIEFEKDTGPPEALSSLF